MKDWAAVTIVARNYLAYATTLLESLARVMPSIDRFVFIVDDMLAQESFESGQILLPTDVFDYELYVNLAHMYDITELSTAVKPFVLRHLLTSGYTRAFYFDPDIEVFAPPLPVMTPLDNADFVLTPHTTDPIPLDGKLPNEITLLAAGAYNLGFIGVRNSSESLATLSWWCERLKLYCVNDVGQNLFVDQKWIDLLPGMVDKVAIVRHRGCNVAYWNLHARHIDECDSRRLYDGTQLFFFHYSGFDVRHPTRISKHQTRFKLVDEPGLRVLLERYAQEVVSRGHLVRIGIPYGFASFSNGVLLDTFSRKELRDAFASGIRFPDPADIFATPSAWNYLNEPAEGQSGPRVVTRYLHQVARKREDLRAVFPDVLGADRDSYLRWLTTDKRTGIDPAYLAATGFRSRALRNSRVLSDVGVRVAGYFRTESGVGEAGRSNALALRTAGIPISLYDFSENAPQSRSDDLTLIGLGSQNQGAEEFPINLLCINADVVPDFILKVGGVFFEKRYNIGSWWWELPEFPDKWMSSFDHFDELWVGTHFIASAITRKSPVPVVIIPPVVNVGRPDPRSRAKFGFSDNETVFLFMFDFLSVVERKNPLGVIAAFQQAFKADESVRLVLKFINSAHNLTSMSQINLIANGDARITVIDRYLSRSDKNDLIASCDAYVSLHRSEGFGFTLAEAMALGRPVIGTAWSGNTDFMTPSNSYCVGYRLVPIGAELGPYGAEQFWAEPLLHEASAAMMAVYRYPEYARKVGALGRLTIQENFSARAVGKLAADRIDLIENRKLARTVKW